MRTNESTIHEYLIKLATIEADLIHVAKDLEQHQKQTGLCMSKHKDSIDDILHFISHQKAVMKVTKIIWGVLSAIVVGLASMGASVYHDIKEQSYEARREVVETRALEIEKKDLDIRQKELELMHVESLAHGHKGVK